MRLLLVLCFALMSIPAFNQRTFEQYYDDGMKYAQRKNYKEAIAYFDMATRLKADDYFSMYQRGVCKALLNDYYAAITDFKMVLEYKPEYFKAYTAIGNCYKRLTHYDTALTYYNTVLNIDTGNLEALYHRATMYEALNLPDSAALDYERAVALDGDFSEKVKYYSDTVKSRPELHEITKLSGVSADKTYGYTPKNPVKVGTGKQGGFSSVRNYLSQLRDEKKNPVKYTRIKACCPYKPKNMPGNVMLEEYDITYTDNTGKETTAKLYLTYYEYDDPKAPLGLNAAGK